MKWLRTLLFLVAAAISVGCSTMSRQPPLFFADGRPAYALPEGLEAGLGSPRLVFLREMFHGPSHPRGLFLGALAGEDEAARALRPFLYDCAGARFAVLGDLDGASGPSLVAVVRPPFVISVGGFMPPQYDYAMLRFRRSSGEEVEYPTGLQRDAGLFWADSATIFPEDPEATIVGVTFYSDSGAAAVHTFSTPLRPSAVRYPDDLAWQAAGAPAPGTARLICEDAPRERRPAELAYLEGTD